MPDTPAAGLIPSRYVLVNYVPSPLGDARIAIGLLLFDAAGKVLRCGFASDWRRVRCLDPYADLELLSGFARHFKAAAARDGEGFHEDLIRMQSEFSGSLQVTQTKGVLTADPEHEFQRLFDQYIATPQPSREKRPAQEGTRPWIHARFSEALRRHSLWDRMAHDIAVDDFTAPGDGFRIDFSYRPNGETRYLHALSLDRDWNHAKLLSYTFWRIRQKSPARMTAIVTHAADAAPRASLPDPTSTGRTAENCRRILTDSGILIQPISAIDPFLDSVASELSVH